MKYKTLLKYIAVILFLSFWTWLSFWAGKINAITDKVIEDLPHVTYDLEELVIVSRSPDWKYHTGFYVAVVTATQKDDLTYDVECKIHIGSVNYFEMIELGQVDTFEEALDKWGHLEWTDNALIIGKDEPYQRIISREQIEKHR